jgi:serine/threonine-protein kinase
VSHLAPEDLQGEAIDQRADLYGLGVVLYELLTGHPVYSGKDELDTIRTVLSTPVPDPLHYRPRIDKSLAQLVRQCLDKEARGRPESAREIAQRLDSWLFAHGYRDDNVEALGRFVRRNAMRQMRWFERIISGREGAAEGEARADAPHPAPLGRANAPR